MAKEQSVNCIGIILIMLYAIAVLIVIMLYAIAVLIVIIMGYITFYK
jgi:hypothetical protein